jgi:6-phosphogluconolactonase
MTDSRALSFPQLFLLASMALLTFVCAACQGSSMQTSTPPPPTLQNPDFAFVANTNSNTISAFQLDPNTGTLAPLPGSPFAAGSEPEFMTADASGKFLFVANSGSGNVSAFQIAAQTGVLTPAPGSPFASGSRPEGIAIDPLGKFVFVGNQASNSISVFSVATDGSLTPISGSPFPSAHPFGLVMNPSGTILYANNFPDSMAADLNTVSAFQMAANGSLSPLPGSPFPTANTSGFAASVGLAADPAGKFLFVGDHMAQAVVPFHIDPATGSLTPTASLPTPPATCGVSCHNNPLRLTVHPNSQFVYSTNVQAGTVSASSVLPNGLSFIADFPVGQHPFGVALDPAGNFLYVVNKVDNTVSAFSVNSSNGMLAPLTGSPFATGSGPTNIVIVTSH